MAEVDASSATVRIGVKRVDVASRCLITVLENSLDVGVLDVEDEAAVNVVDIDTATGRLYRALIDYQRIAELLVNFDGTAT